MPLQGGVSIERMCQLAGVSRAGLYRWLQEPTPIEEEMELRSVIHLGAVLCDTGELRAEDIVFNPVSPDAPFLGEEKPLKYPVMFRAADVVVVNKVDLLPHLDFDLYLFLSNLNAVNPTAEVILASARTGQGVSEWCTWLAGQCSLVAGESTA